MGLKSWRHPGGWGYESKVGYRCQFIIQIHTNRRTGERRGNSWADYYQKNGRTRSATGYTEEDDYEKSDKTFNEWIVWNLQLPAITEHS